jgi:hypothetical protein
MDRESLIILLRGGHLSMEDRIARGIWPHPPVKMSALVATIAEVLEREKWFPRRWEPAAPGKPVHEGGTIQRIGPRRFIYRAQRHHAVVPTVLAESVETVFSTAKGAVRHYLRWDLNLPGKLRENGADIQDMQEALGHAVITTTTMYAHLTTRRQREKLAEYLK